MQIDIQVKMGNVHMLKKDWQVAIFNFKSCEDKETSPKFFMNFAECLQQLEQYKPALEKLNMAVDAFYKKGEISSSVGEFTKCLFTRGQIHQRKNNLKVRLIRRPFWILPLRWSRRGSSKRSLTSISCSRGANVTAKPANWPSRFLT